ncbi:MAG TPA: hypothetical protein VFZ61_09915 [Polyangiales bacterium]
MEQEAPSSSNTKLFVAQVAGGAVIGFILSSVFGPTVISWWYEPPSRDAFSCASSVRSALGQFVTMQLICAALGAIALTLIVFLTRRAMRNRGQSKASPA